ncbi:hypothetical protein DPMN_077109 [Dreissena polymorpha]|uniref:Uncharacterized protein n=1 Tax=Dreissena polymorpha TaxID=45954 RepID=A0A9D4BR23_DREPO|nr:hypothetical protein DPMN_077109 [Dreissena polymorpha]
MLALDCLKKKCPSSWRLFLTNQIIFELVVLTSKNPPPPVGYIFQTTVIIFELVQDSIETNLLTNFHDDQTSNVASRELTSQILTPHDAQRTTHNERRTKSDHKGSP